MCEGVEVLLVVTVRVLYLAVVMSLSCLSYHLMVAVVNIDLVGMMVLGWPRYHLMMVVEEAVEIYLVEVVMTGCWSYH